MTQPESSVDKIVRLSGKSMPPWLKDKVDEKEDKKSPSEMTDAELKAAHKKEASKKKMPWMKDEESKEMKEIMAEMKKRDLK